MAQHLSRHSQLLECRCQHHCDLCPALRLLDPRTPPHSFQPVRALWRGAEWLRHCHCGRGFLVVGRLV